MSPSLQLQKIRSDRCLDGAVLALALFGAACGRVGDPVARIQFGDGSGSGQKAAVGALGGDGCTVTTGSVASFTTSDGIQPVERYAEATFGGILNNVLLGPSLALSSGASSLDLPVSQGAPNILVGSAYLVQSTPSVLDCSRTSSPSRQYHRLVFPMLGFTAQKTYTRTENVSLTMNFGRPLSLIAPSPLPDSTLSLPSIPSGMRMLSVPRLGISAVTTPVTILTGRLPYAVVTDEVAGVSALALSFSGHELSTYNHLSGQCSSVFGPMCAGFHDAALPLNNLAIMDVSANEGITHHALGPLLPGRTYRIRWEYLKQETGAPPSLHCFRKATVQIPFGPSDQRVELLDRDITSCALETADGLPDSALF